MVLFIPMINFRDIAVLIRPHHWVKNLLVIAPAFFGGVLFESMGNITAVLMAFMSFSFASSAGYILNDLADREFDNVHPKKKNRPIPSGRIERKTAFYLMVMCLCLSLVFAIGLPYEFAIVVLGYLILTTSYTSYLKNVVIVDSFCIAGGFLFRIAGGGLAIGVSISSWLFLTTFLLSLLLAFGKRRAELNYNSDSDSFREVLKYYNAGFLDTTIAIFATTSILSFSLYTVNVGPEIFIITVPFVCFGVLRYIYLVQIDATGDPTEVLISDRWLLSSVIIWLLITGIIIYFYDLLSFH